MKKLNLTEARIVLAILNKEAELFEIIKDLANNGLYVIIQK